MGGGENDPTSRVTFVLTKSETNMRLELTLQHPPNQELPINYQYLIASWIYRTLGNADADFAKQLHNHGYDFGGKKYKPVSYTHLTLPTKA